ncbi:MAG: NAD(+) synthase [Clostridiales bacterium]|nr:NAD(+) synthase [Clostridiales bacterium]
MQGILRVAAAVPHLCLGDVERNVAAHLEKIAEAKERGAALVVFPELSLTGASCGDLFHQRALQDAVFQGLEAIAERMPEGITVVVGAPIAARSGLYNCAVVISREEGITHIAPKVCLSGRDGAFVSGAGADMEAVERLKRARGDDVVMDSRVLVTSEDGVTIGIEVGEDMYAPIAPSTQLALMGAEVIVNLSAMPELVGSSERLHDAVRMQSARCLCGYVLVSAGRGESAADHVYSGHSVAACCGEVLAENPDRFADDYLMTVDIDLERIRAERQRSQSFSAAMRHCGQPKRACWMPAALLPDDILPGLHIPKLPFVPENKHERARRCGDIFEIQANGLARRMEITGGKVVVGISGGLDSTLALLVACRAADILALPRTNILAVTMPCFGTTDWTYQSALELMGALGVTQREIRIHQSVRQHFADIGHDERVRNVTYENAQARERTQVLMDLSNDFGGIVLGTGDLSELALGWCTYNGDHMCMYGVNGGVPKTLVRWVTKTVSEMPMFAAARGVLERILDTPISPELLPPDEHGSIAQQTEDLVGPYALHDFFLYYAVRYGYAPRRIYEMCCIAFKDDFDQATILKWLKNFYRRFISQQFKRNCMPDGVAVGSIGLSPRGAWHMPSDALANLWLAECERL